MADPHGPTTARRGPRLWLIVLITGVCVVAAAIGVVFYKGYAAGQALVRDQSAYHAVICTCDLVATWVEREKGNRWPASWADLESLPAKDFGSFAWPADESKLRDLVDIDFSATIDAVLKQRPDAFTAIRPRSQSTVFKAAAVYQDLQQRIARAG